VSKRLAHHIREILNWQPSQMNLPTNEPFALPKEEAGESAK
jgi:hypothetical protein